MDGAQFDEAEKQGDYNLLFARTWGAPYDPHSYFSSFAQPAHSEYAALSGIEPPLVTRDELLEKIDRVQKESDVTARRELWREILQNVHEQAIFLPLWGTRIPYVINRRLVGFSSSPQSYAYDLTSVRVFEGSPTVTVAPGSSVGGLFDTAGSIHPHQYFPNQLFAQGWIYEGLVSYGQDGEIGPALAHSWTIDPNPETGGERAAFQLRNATFHDGTAFNCSVAKLNFDHVLNDVVKERHSWYQLPTKLTSWTCNDQGDFVLETSEPFYPLLQELTYMRPLTFASAAAFPSGLDSHPINNNACNPGDFGGSYAHLEDTVTCNGLLAPIGTGPFKLVTSETNEEGTIQTKLQFARHDEYWGNKPDIEVIDVKYFETTEDVEKALLDGTLDMALGIGPLSPQQIRNLKDFHSDVVDVRHSNVQRHAMMVFNTNKEPTNDLIMRQAIIHAVDKARFIEEEFAGLERPVSQLLPYTAPYCDVELSPKWAYDQEKAILLNCPTEKSNSALSGGAIAGIVICALVATGLAIFVLRLIQREKSGKPLFTPVSSEATASMPAPDEVKVGAPSVRGEPNASVSSTEEVSQNQANSHV